MIGDILFNLDWLEQPFIFVSSKVSFAKLGFKECSYKTISKNAEGAVRKCSSEAVAQKCSVKKGVLRELAKFAGKHLCQSLFINKVAGQGRQLYLKRDLARVFPVNFAKFGKTPFLTEHLWWLFLVLQNRCSYKCPDIHQKKLCWSSFLIQFEAWRPATLIKKRPQHKGFPVNITTF